MWEWMLALFDTEGFPPRWHCGTWPAWLGWLHIAADVLTFVSYTAIPVVLASFLLRRRDAPFPRVFVLFATFIFACGAVHVVEAMIFWHPMYYLSGALKAVTAVASIATVVALVPTMRAALRLPGFQRVTARLASIVSASSDAVISKDLDGIIESWNAAAERMYGYRADEVVGRSIEVIVPLDRRAELAEYSARVRRGDFVPAFETERVTKDGERVPISLSVSPVFGPKGEPIAISAIARDIRERKRAEQQLRESAAQLARANERLRGLADHDPLTGLCNRRGFEAALALEVERMRRHGTSAAVVLIDCDDFKAVNERFGHDGGDEVLRAIAARIGETARQVDTVARLGGDEFVVLVSGARLAEAVRFADRVRAAVAARPVPLANGEADVRVSCGVEAVDAEHDQLDALVRDSSAALHAAKAVGKDATEVAGEAVRELPTGRDLQPVAQAIVRVRSGEAVAYEFLIRGPAGPLRAPERLFRAFRARDELSQLDLDCLERCLQVARHVERSVGVHVNLLPSTLIERGEQAVVERLQRFGDARRVCVELNEAMLVGDPSALVPHIVGLRREAGCRVALDDVGFGRSSLEALVRLEPEVIKIDRHYVHGVGDDPVLRRGLARLVGVGRGLEAELIAEGVERDADRQVLADLGVAFAQGFLFGRLAQWN